MGGKFMRLKHFKKENGQAMVEYGLILALIAVVVIIALRTLGTATQEKLDEVGAAISSP